MAVNYWQVSAWGRNKQATYQRFIPSNHIHSSFNFQKSYQTPFHWISSCTFSTENLTHLITFKSTNKHIIWIKILCRQNFLQVFCKDIYTFISSNCDTDKWKWEIELNCHLNHSSVILLYTYSLFRFFLSKT